MDVVKDIIYTDGACKKNGDINAKGGFGIYIFTSSIGNDISIAKQMESETFVYKNITYNFPVTNNRAEGWAIIYVMVIFYYKYITLNGVCDVDKDNKKTNGLRSNLISKLNIIDILEKKLLIDSKTLKIHYTESDLAVIPLQEPKVVHIYTDSKFWINVFTTWMPNWITKNIILDKKNPDILLYGNYYINVLEHHNIHIKFHHVNSHQKGHNISEHAKRNNHVDIIANKAVNLKNNKFTLID